jgi:hypothetical protein
MSFLSVRCLLSGGVSEGSARVGRHTLEHGTNASMVVVAEQEVSGGQGAAGGLTQDLDSPSQGAGDPCRARAHGGALTWRGKEMP